MDEQEPGEQFEATDYDEDGNIKLPPPPLAAAKPKRLTVADLKKELDDLKADIEHDVLDWLGNLDIRLESLEATTATHNKVLLGDVKLRLDTLEGVSTKILPAFIDDMAKKCDNQDAAIGALVDALRTYGEGIADWGSRMEECEDSITSLQTANVDIQESAEHTELEFAQPPQQTAGEHTRAGDIDVVASACQTMNDVLMITRVLKADREILDEERTYIITIACRAADVPLSPGLQIRAGVRNVEA